VLHDGSPRCALGVARIDEPGTIASEDLERRPENVAHHPVEVIRSLDGAVDPVHRLEEPQVRAVLLLGMPQIGDVDHEADHALGLALGVEEHAPFRPQPVNVPSRWVTRYSAAMSPDSCARLSASFAAASHRDA
jgi:hypothetical protein